MLVLASLPDYLGQPTEHTTHRRRVSASELLHEPKAWRPSRPGSQITLLELSLHSRRWSPDAETWTRPTIVTTPCTCTGLNVESRRSRDLTRVFHPSQVPATWHATANQDFLATTGLRCPRNKSSLRTYWLCRHRNTLPRSRFQEEESVRRLMTAVSSSCCAMSSMKSERQNARTLLSGLCEIKIPLPRWLLADSQVARHERVGDSRDATSLPC
jgi:hypothetical protein